VLDIEIIESIGKRTIHNLSKLILAIAGASPRGQVDEEIHETMETLLILVIFSSFVEETFFGLKSPMIGEITS